MDVSLQDKHAFVCGSTQGIGRAVAIELARQGATVTLLARDEERLAKVVSELPRSHHQNHDYLVADFQQPETLRDRVQKYMQHAQKTIHILVNNTGGPAPGALLDASTEDLLNAYQMHLLCSHHLVQALVPGMKKAGYGRIIQVISTSVKAPIPGLGVSNTTRGAVAFWAKTLAGELGAYGITVNNVLPGQTDTERLRAFVRIKANKLGISEEEAATQMQADSPVRRFGKPAEIANVIAFLATPAASFVNGANIPVDGGKTLSH